MMNKSKIDNVKPEQELNDAAKADVPTSSPSSTKPHVGSSLSQIVDDIIATTERFQDECHTMTKEIIKQSPKCTVQDATNVWMFKKFAEFEVRLRQLEFVVQP